MKQLITCWYPVSLADKFGLLCYMILAYRHSHHKLEKGRLRIGGHLQAAEFQVKSKKGWTPSSFMAPGPYGVTATNVYLMESDLTHPMLSVLSKKKCSNGPLRGLEEFPISSPWQFQPLRGVFWSSVSGHVCFCKSLLTLLLGWVGCRLCCPDTRIRIPVRDTGILRYVIFSKTRIRGYANIYKKIKTNKSFRN